MSQAPAADPRAVVVSPSAIIDHAYSLTTAQVRSLLGPEALGGSSRVPFDTLLRLQQSLPQDASAGTVSPAGSAPNVARNLARQGARVRLVRPPRSGSHPTTPPCQTRLKLAVQRKGLVARGTVRNKFALLLCAGYRVRG